MQGIHKEFHHTLGCFDYDLWCLYVWFLRAFLFTQYS